jgi:hypothetical protein
MSNSATLKAKSNAKEVRFRADPFVSKTRALSLRIFENRDTRKSHAATGCRFSSSL